MRLEERELSEDAYSHQGLVNLEQYLVNIEARIQAAP
jgi:hypothetical protein